MYRFRLPAVSIKVTGSDPLCDATTLLSAPRSTVKVLLDTAVTSRISVPIRMRKFPAAGNNDASSTSSDVTESLIPLSRVDAAALANCSRRGAVMGRFSG
jgi:hypothetical protein